MKPIAIFRHIDCEGPGYFAEFLQARALPYTLIAIDRQDEVPDTVDAFSALVFMGGNMSVNDPLPWIARELDLIRQALEREMPVLGHCLGGQLISKALGGTVERNPVPEVGWFNVDIVDTPLTAAWTGNAPASPMAFHWHGETFSLPCGATRLLTNRHCANQGFVIGNTLGLQCHVEMTRDMVQEWVQRFLAQWDHRQPTVQTATEIISELETNLENMRILADALYRRWIRPVVGDL